MRIALALALLAVLAPAAAAHEPRSADGGTLLAESAPSLARAAAQMAVPPATPQDECGPGSTPEPDLQGRVPAGSKGFSCNLQLLGREGAGGGFKVHRYVDKAGRECAFYDTTLLFPLNAASISENPTGVGVLDMSNPSKPVRTATLMTPAMQSPHESLVLNEKRGLLVAVMGNALTYPGFVDIYDVSEDCRTPALQSSLPVGLLGHESGFAPDGRTFYATSLFTGMVTAVDVTNPKAPTPIWSGNFPSHGMSVSDDGNRIYMAGLTGLIIADTSEVQARKPNPQVRELSRLTWPTMSIPQNALPVTIGGKPYLVEIDEFSDQEGTSDNPFPAANGNRVGAGRIIDISDDRKPRVVSDLRLEVNQPDNRARVARDPGASSSLQGYAGHYCAVPQRRDPGVVACSFIASGLRVFDIRDPLDPREIAYFVAPPAPSPSSGEPSNYAMSAPAFAPSRGEIWYSDGNSGFYALKVTNGVWPFTRPRRAIAPAATLPGSRPCASRRAFTIRLARDLVAARVVVDGKRVRTIRGRRLRAPVNLRGLPRGRFTVRVVGRTRAGATRTSTRAYRTCVPRRP